MVSPTLGKPCGGTGSSRTSSWWGIRSVPLRVEGEPPWSVSVVPVNRQRMWRGVPSLAGGRRREMRVALVRMLGGGVGSGETRRQGDKGTRGGWHFLRVPVSPCHLV